jgi:hypothetical protein
MNWNMVASILFIVVIAIELYQIFGLGQYTWSDYLTVILIAAALVLILKGELSSKA